MLYNLQYRDLATLTTTTVTGIDALFYDVIGLQSNTQYEFRVQEDDGTTTSSYSDWAQFVTENTFAIKVNITGSFPRKQKIDGSFQRKESIKGNYFRKISI